MNPAYERPSIHQLGAIGNLTKTNSPNQAVDLPQGTQASDGDDVIGPLVS